MQPYGSEFKSYITFNGVNASAILHGEQGLAWKTSKPGPDWRFDLEWGKYGAYKGKRWDDSRSSVGGLIIATSTPYLELPFTDFINLQGELFEH